MLGWMLGRENAPDAIGDGDTTQIDLPDTPAPVFAARAFKSALFGTPAPKTETPQKSRAKGKVESNATTMDGDVGTPMRRQGILLTPGTGTSRRKRVSFNHEALTTTKSISPNEGGGGGGGRDGASKRTRLTEALEKAKRKGNGNGAAPTKADAPQDKAGSDSEWEEEEEGEVYDCCMNDFTLDLNEPHSQSGKYWKGEFERYRKEAAAEMEKLVKYKQRAKSYAREKDMEAMRLAEKLREEQEKVIAMEKKIADNASQMASSKQRGSGGSESAEILATLTQQTALATQYRHRVQELEERLEGLLKGRGEDDDDDEPKSRRRRAAAPSPTTQRTLLDTQRELRRARAQLKELDALREQVSSLKSQLKKANRQEGLPTAEAGADTVVDPSIVQDLKAQLKKAKEECAERDEELGQLKHEFESFRKESEDHDADAKAVLERAHAKISDLKKEVRSLKTAASTAEHAQPKSVPLKVKDDYLSKDDLSVELPVIRAVVPRASRRSLDLADLDRPEASQTLREKYQKPTINVLADKPNLAKPRWQPFVPRSPRNRANLDGLPMRRAGGKPSKLGAPDLPSITTRTKPSPLEGGDMEVDLLQDRFARLGGPEALPDDGRRSTMSSDRRAATLARIQKRVEQKRAQRRNGYDKENVRP